MKTRLGKSWGRKTSGVTVRMSDPLGHPLAERCGRSVAAEPREEGQHREQRAHLGGHDRQGGDAGAAEAGQQRGEVRARAHHGPAQAHRAEEPGELGIGHQWRPTGVPVGEDPPHDPGLETDRDRQAGGDPRVAPSGRDGEQRDAADGGGQRRRPSPRREHQGGDSRADRPDPDAVPAVGHGVDGEESEAEGGEHQQPHGEAPGPRHHHPPPRGPTGTGRSKRNRRSRAGSNAGRRPRCGRRRTRSRRSELGDMP